VQHSFICIVLLWLSRAAQHRSVKRQLHVAWFCLQQFRKRYWVSV